MEHNPTTEALSYVYSEFESGFSPSTKQPANSYQTLTCSSGYPQITVSPTAHTPKPLRLASLQKLAYNPQTILTGSSVSMDNHIQECVYKQFPTTFFSDASKSVCLSVDHDNHTFNKLRHLLPQHRTTPSPILSNHMRDPL